MTIENSKLEKYVQIFNSSNNPSEIIDGLTELRQLQASISLSISNRLEVQLPAFQTLKTILNKHQVDIVERIILEFILPDCFLLDEPSGFFVAKHRELLSEWINNLDDDDRNRIRSKVIGVILHHLESSTPQAACWIISSIGYRDDEIFRSLTRIAKENDNEIGDIALSTLTWLGIPASEKPAVLLALHSKAANRFNTRLLWGIARLGDSSSAQVILDNWLTLQKRNELSVDASLAFTALREISDTNTDDEGLQDLIWTECKRLIEQDPKNLYWDFDIGHVLEKCNSTDVIPTLLLWHGQYPDWFENPNWSRYLMYDRIEKCVKPRQLAGWHLIGSSEIFNIIKKDASIDTEHDLLAQSQETMQKETAWGTLLRAGYEPALNWFDEAVTKETGRFLRQDVMELFACFLIDPLPTQVIRWITEVYDHPNNHDGREFGYRMAAVRMARSAATKVAFDALLNFGVTYNKQVIKQNSDAVAEVTIALARQIGEEIVDRLFVLLKNSDVPRQRLVCAYALESLATFPEFLGLLLPKIEHVIPLLHDEHRDNVERGTLLNFLALVPGWKIQESLLLNLREWAQNSDRWISGGSLRVLVLHDEIERLPDLMRSALGIESTDAGWILVKGTNPSQWAPHFVGWLYHKQPENYASVVSQLLLQRDWHPSAQLLYWLKKTHTIENQPSIPPMVLNALFQRVKKFYSPTYGETEVFDVLATIAPNALVEQEWDIETDNWIADTQVAFANALGRVVTTHENKSVCLAQLEKLATKGLYSVRRAAYRGLAKQSQDHLYQICRSWLSSKILNLKVRAAEAVGWIEFIPKNAEQDGFLELYNVCITDPEPKVREAAKNTWDERRKRFWAREYLDIILIVKGENNREILDAWCYGDALSQIGDDECLRTLEEHLSKKDLLPHTRYWFGRITNHLESNWKKVTQKWPDPWIDMKDVIETGNGNLILASGDKISIKYSIWRKMGRLPGEIHAWGGIIISSFTDFIGLDRATLELQNQLRGQIILNGFAGNTATFLGTGSYPS